MFFKLIRQTAPAPAPAPRAYVVKDRYTHIVLHHGTAATCRQYIAAFGRCYMVAA